MRGGRWRLVAVMAGLLAAFLFWQNALLRGNTRRLRREAAAAAEREREVDQDRDRGAAGGARSEADVAAALSAALPAAADPTGAASATEDAEPPRPQRHWLVEFFTPKPGENLLAYRDRVLPVVQAAVEPQRRRVRRQYDEFARDAALSEAQQREIDAAVAEGGELIKDRIMQAVLSGEIGPRTKASTAVAFARDVLDIADKANRRARGALSADQNATLDGSRFDVVDYLFFSTRWEDLLGVEE